MKAVILESNGNADALKYVKDFPDPKAGPGQAVVRLKATSLNRIDIVMRNGYPGLQMNFPHILGGDIAGEIVETGEGVADLKAGDRVVSYPIILPKQHNPKFGRNPQLNMGWRYYGMHMNGSYSEYVLCDVSTLVKLPLAVSYEEAACLPVAGLTAYHAVKSVADLKEGDIFMLWGGSGGFGTIAVQLAKNMGATVITTCSSEEKRQVLEKLGADHIFDHNNDDVEAKVKELFPGGVDAVMDYVGPVTFEKSHRMLRNDGTLLLCGMLTGREVTLNIQQTYFRHLNIRGLFLGSPHDFKNLIQLVSMSDIKPHIHEKFDLSEAAEAHKLMESGRYSGKIVLTAE